MDTIHFINFLIKTASAKVNLGHIIIHIILQFPEYNGFYPEEEWYMDADAWETYMSLKTGMKYL